MEGTRYPVFVAHTLIVTDSLSAALKKLTFTIM